MIRKKGIRKLIALVMASVLMLAMVPAINAEAATQQLVTRLIYLEPDSSFVSFELSAGNAKTVKNVKSSNKTAVIPYFISYASTKNDNLDKNGKIKSTDKYTNTYVYFKARNAGTATVSFVAGNTTYKQKVIVKKYTNPLKTLTISSVQNEKNLAGLFKKQTSGSAKPSSSKTLKVSATANSDWQITDISISNSYINYKSSTKFEDTENHSNNIYRYYKTPVKTGSLTLKDYNNKGSGLVSVHARNKKDGYILNLTVQLTATTK